nr:diacylglycerol kinase 5-like isoform X1 [Tanacetum cinerariifolium]
MRPTMDVVRKELEETLEFQLELIKKYPHLYSDNFLKDFYIPDYILFPGGNIEVPSDAPACPTLVFINSESSGQLGGELLVTYRSLLNQNQVFDLGEDAPDEVLHRVYLTLDYLRLNGDTLANNIKQRLRVIVAGGDGTVNVQNWLWREIVPSNSSSQYANSWFCAEGCLDVRFSAEKLYNDTQRIEAHNDYN